MLLRSQSCASLILLSFVLVPYTLAQKKPKNMSISMMQVEGCNAMFSVEQDPNPFLTNVLEIKEKGVVKFSRGKETLENFPDEITLKVYYRPIVVGFMWPKPTTACKPIDPGSLKFKVAWSNKSRTLAARSTVMDTQRYGPESLCEDKCTDWWTYELHVESKDVRLTDDLSLMIYSAEGSQIATLMGGLGPLEHANNPAAPFDRRGIVRHSTYVNRSRQRLHGHIFIFKVVAVSCQFNTPALCGLSVATMHQSRRAKTALFRNLAAAANSSQS